MLKLNDYVQIEGQGFGKVSKVYDDMIVITICEQNYYRGLDDMEDVTPATENEYMIYLKVMIKQLTEQSKTKRKQAAEFNKSTNGEAVKRKGKVSVIENNITSLVENSLSSHHRGLICDAKKAKEMKDKFKKELEFLKNLEKIRKGA